MQVSIVICTRNRAPMLRGVLQSLVECKKPADRDCWEVIVVDNGSSDRTPAVAEEYRASLPLRFVREERPGLSSARNRGVREAHGSWILWIDDDVTVRANWLEAYLEAIARFPRAAALGGPIVIDFDGDPPTWLSRGLEWVKDAYAARSPTRFKGRFHSKGPKPYGANFGLRTAAARLVPFDMSLGRHPSRPTMGGEEMDVLRKVLSDGEGWWVPEASVVHHIDSSRQTARYVWSYYSSAGQLKARSAKDPTNPRRIHRLAGAIAKAGACYAAYVVLSVLRDGRFRARALRDAAWNWGYVKGCAATSHGAERKGALI